MVDEKLLNPSGSIVIKEMITRIRVRDAMNSLVLTGKVTATMREIQNIMRESKISGVPICDDNGILTGMITVDDIIKALDGNYINDCVEKHMSKDIITLDADLPLSVAFSYFGKYQFRRFPIVDSNKKLTGIISGRDILSKMLELFNQEVGKLEEMIPEEKMISQEFYYKKYSVAAKDMTHAGNASGEIKNYCGKCGMSRNLCRRIGVAAFELEINIAVHSYGGTLSLSHKGNELQIISQDIGPGIEDIELAMQEGYSSANDWVRSYGFGAGMGLPNIKRVSDVFDIKSSKEKGTVVTATFFIDGEKHEIL
ncbi:MAG: CBS domain-containing protein [Chitinispirillales bacterium]|nr:CBS domain-containing protein [Chitinispirillales bacterium]